MPIGAVASTAQGTAHPITPQVSQPAAAPDSHNIQASGASLVLKPIDESHKSAKISNRHDPDSHLGETEESEWLEKKYKHKQRLGLNVDQYV